jgi:hypothetical protein
MTDPEYEQQISTYGWLQLNDLWQAIDVKDTPGWSKGKAFEYLIVRAFELSGAKVRYPYSVREDGQTIEQIDGVIYYHHFSCLLECKDQTDPVNFEPIAKLRSQLMRRATTIGNVFSMSGFTEPALKLMRTLSPQIILLWQREEIELCLKGKDIIEAFLLKYRYYVEECGLDLNIEGIIT